MPSLREGWDDDENLDDEGRLHYMDAAAAAHHAVRLLARRKRMAEVTAFLALVERLHVEGDEYVRELATIGFLEDFQTGIDKHHTLTRDAVLPLLGPESARWWRALDRFWNGEAPLVMLDDDPPAGPDTAGTDGG